MLRPAALVLLFLSGTAHAATLKATTLAVDEKVLLSDLFEGIAGDAVLSAAPMPGRILTMAAPQLLRIAQTYGLDWRPAGGERVVITRRETEVSVPVLTRRVAAGELIQQADVTMKKVPARLATHAVTDSDLVAGRGARRVLQPETPLQRADLVAPHLVRRGETVSITLDDGVMLLVTQGEVQMDGAAGERVRVVNSSSKKSIDAIVTGVGQVSVDVPRQSAPAS
ncbi:flagellar basal body P-ring formation chaperone FlgA [Roseiterribacter gracilis]|uniref:Flagella basal body P-ring formation protein FlgA n=1 Tax=Roseiterribacter gracilis TaxID=2812848 RepID=A0A8S8XFY3_9PROT|nr:flagellar basal body P-ring biosynthesis protein FlgA [Rhodospirillales bacterium TMPK1]